MPGLGPDQVTRQAGPNTGDPDEIATVRIAPDDFDNLPAVDDGSSQPALLREPLSGTTWVIWRYDWPFQAGEHTFTVRCFEADGK